jgi:hypothetical protein
MHAFDCSVKNWYLAVAAGLVLFDLRKFDSRWSAASSFICQPAELLEFRIIKLSTLLKIPTFWLFTFFQHSILPYVLISQYFPIFHIFKTENVKSQKSKNRLIFRKKSQKIFPPWAKNRKILKPFQHFEKSKHFWLFFQRLWRLMVFGIGIGIPAGGIFKFLMPSYPYFSCWLVTILWYLITDN